MKKTKKIGLQCCLADQFSIILLDDTCLPIYTDDVSIIMLYIFIPTAVLDMEAETVLREQLHCTYTCHKLQNLNQPHMMKKMPNDPQVFW